MGLHLLHRRWDSALIRQFAFGVSRDIQHPHHHGMSEAPGLNAVDLAGPTIQPSEFTNVCSPHEQP